MRRVGALVLLVLVSAVLRAQLRPPEPHAIPAAETQRADTAEARGRLVYIRYGCVLCHGADAAGGRANPNSETDGKIPGVIYVAEGYTKQELSRLIRNGVPRIGRLDAAGPIPPYRMPGWGNRISDEEIGDLVQYLMGLMPESARKSWR